MLRCARVSLGIALISLAIPLACSAPAADPDSSVPAYLGPVPASPVPTGTPAVGGTSGAPPASNGVGGASTSDINNPGDVPVNGGAGGSASTPAGNGGSGQGGTQNPPPETPDGPVGSGCAPGAAFFCEDFETFAVGAAQQNDRWRPEGTVAIDDQVVRGARSLHVQANAGQASRIFVNGFAPPNNSFYGRMNVFVQSFPTAPNYAHYVLVEVTGNGGERVRPIGGQLIQDQNVGNVWGVGSDGGATGDWTAWRATAPAVAGEWLCMEWQMDASDNSVDVYIDETLKPELSVSTNEHDGNGAFVFPTFNNIWLGWTVFQGGSVPAPFQVYLDDIVLSTERVGCP